MPCTNTGLPHMTRRTGFPQIAGHSGPPLHPHASCTSPSDRCRCEAPSCAAPLGWRSCPGHPCKNSLQAPVPTCPVLLWCLDLSVPDTEAYCCWASARRAPAFHLRQTDSGKITRGSGGGRHYYIWVFFRVCKHSLLKKKIHCSRALRDIVLLLWNQYVMVFHLSVYMTGSIKGAAHFSLYCFSLSVFIQWEI